MSRIFAYFARGCLVLMPAVITVYALVTLVGKMDQWLGVTIPGLGLVLVLSVTTVVGFMASHYLGRSVYAILDRWMERVPVVRILYRSTRDILSALMGEQAAFGTPVLVRFDRRSEARVLGFLTREGLPQAGLAEHVAVYVPQAYNIGGQVLLLPRDLIEPFEAPATDVLTFVLSGGATGLGAGAPNNPKPSP